MGCFEIVQCTCNHQENPLGLDRTPRFGWKMRSDTRGDTQTAYRITVSTDARRAQAGQGDVWDSGQTAGDGNVSVAYAGPPLQPRTRYYWCVTAWNRAGEAAVSRPAFFETGKLNEAWRARWITAPFLKMDKTDTGAPYLRRTFPLRGEVRSARLRVSTRNMAMSRQKKLDKMDVIELAAEKPKPEFHFKYGRTPGKYIFETKDLVIGYNEPLSRPVTLSMERGNKIALVGANGIGKTTLLKSILGLIPSLKGSCELGENLQIGYFEQEVKGDNKTTCIDEIWAEFPSYTQYEFRSALAKCGLTTKHIESQVRVLSGGEQAKVRLCKLVNKETNILLLDEPTNHLDVDAKEALKQALIEYKGSILLICHEPEFYRDVVSQVWDCSKWTTKVL